MEEQFVVITTDAARRTFGPFPSRRAAFDWAQTTDELEPLDFVDIRPLEEPTAA